MAVDKIFAAAGAASAFIAVAAGAFAAHTLRSRLSPELLVTFETGARYQMYHALAMLLVAWASSRWPGGALQFAGWAFAVGTILFCGSLYILALTGLRWVGAITPIGGAAFLLGWLAFAWGAWKQGT